MLSLYQPLVLNLSLLRLSFACVCARACSLALLFCTLYRSLSKLSPQSASTIYRLLSIRPRPFSFSPLPVPPLPPSTPSYLVVRSSNPPLSYHPPRFLIFFSSPTFTFPHVPKIYTSLLHVPKILLPIHMIYISFFLLLPNISPLSSHSSI